MAKGGSEFAAEGVEGWEIVGEYRRAVAGPGVGRVAGTTDPDQAAPMGGRIARGKGSWRAGCVETRTSGSEGGLRKRNVCKGVNAPQSDPTRPRTAPRRARAGPDTGRRRP